MEPPVGWRARPVSDHEQFGTMWTTGGLSVLFDFDVAVMGALGRQVPDNARTIIPAAANVEKGCRFQVVGARTTAGKCCYDLPTAFY